MSETCRQSYDVTTCTWLLIAALFETARDRQKPKCLSVGVGSCYFHTKGHSAAVKGMRMVCTPTLEGAPHVVPKTLSYGTVLKRDRVKQHMSPPIVSKRNK